MTLSIVSVQSLSGVWLFATPRTAARQAFLFFVISQSLLKLMSSELAMPSHHLILCRPLLLLPSVFPSIRVLSNELLLWIRRPKYWSFSFRISPSNKYSGLISLRIGWFDLLVKDTLKIKTTTKFESYCVPGTVLKSLYSFCVFSARTYASPLRALRLVRSVGK